MSLISAALVRTHCSLALWVDTFLPRALIERKQTHVCVCATMSVKKKSKAWEYFDLSEDGTQAACRLCPVKLAYKNSTGSLRNHLQKKHLDVNLDTGASQSQTQARITSFTTSTTSHRRCDPGRSEKINQLIAQMTATDMLPPLLC